MADVSTYIIADTCDLARLGVGILISRRRGQAGLYDVTDSAQLVDRLKHTSARAVVVLDYSRFDIQSVDRLLILISRFSAASWVILSADLTPTLVQRLSGEQRVTFAHKWDSAAEISAAIEAAVSGQNYMTESVKRMAVTSHDAELVVLTPAETEILALIARGKSAREIADDRRSSIHTIITHKKNIFRKIGVSTTYEATRYALRAGLADPIEYYL